MNLRINCFELAEYTKELIKHFFPFFLCVPYLADMTMENSLIFHKQDMRIYGIMLRQIQVPNDEACHRRRDPHVESFTK